MIIFNQKSEDKFVLDKDSLKNLPQHNSTIKKLATRKKIVFQTFDDHRGANCKFWIENDSFPNGLLFKYPQSRRASSTPKELLYGELICGLICDAVGFPHTEYFPCQFNMLDGQVLVGTLSPSYLESNFNKEYSAETITARYVRKQYDNNRGIVENMEHNTVYEYIKQLKYLYSKEINQSSLVNFKHYLLKLSMLDYLTWQIDRHWGNIGWMTVASKGLKSMNIIPTFDNECCFNLDASKEHLQNFSQILNYSQNYKKRYTVPMSNKTENTPLLGIKTTLVTTKEVNGKIMFRNRKDFNNNVKGSEVFLQELTEELIANPKLDKFYKKLKSLDINKLISESGYFPEHISNVVCKCWDTRMQQLNDYYNLQKRSSYENQPLFQ